MMARGMLIPADPLQELRIVEVDGADFRSVANAIGAQFIEVVRNMIHQPPADAVMVVDENGRVLGKPANLFACYMYGTFDHGQPIVGDAMLIAEGKDGFTSIPTQFEAEALSIFKQVRDDLIRRVGQ